MNPMIIHRNIIHKGVSTSHQENVTAPNILSIINNIKDAINPTPPIIVKKNLVISLPLGMLIGPIFKKFSASSILTYVLNIYVYMSILLWNILSV